MAWQMDRQMYRYMCLSEHTNNKYFVGDPQPWYVNSAVVIFKQ